ncbi:MAG: FCD domain-containing protein [Clostridia bacterium]
METSFQPIRDERLSDKVTAQLLEAMRSGNLPVGTRLPAEAQLAEQFGISRGILREALTVLEARGYIRRTPKEGTFIKSVHGDDLGHSLSKQLRQATYRDLLEFREVMERRVVEDIVLRATDAQISELAELLDCSPERPNEPSVDYYFHYRLATLSGNCLFTSFIDTYYELISEMKSISLQNEARRKAIRNEHMEIVRALQARDAKAAKQAIRAHLKAVRKNVEKEE